LSHLLVIDGMMLNIGGGLDFASDPATTRHPSALMLPSPLNQSSPSVTQCVSVRLCDDRYCNLYRVHCKEDATVVNPLEQVKTTNA